MSELSPALMARLKEMWNQPLPDNPVPPPFRTLPDYHDWQTEYMTATSRLRYWPHRPEFFYDHETKIGFEILPGQGPYGYNE